MRRSALLSLAAVIALSSVSTAQDSPPALPGVFSEVLDVRVINLEVIVTDKSGTPIAGLEPQDFRLLVDGEEVPIEYFSEVRGGVAVAAPGADGVEGIPAVVAGEPVGTSYLVFIDEFFSTRQDRNAVLKALKSEIVRMTPEDRMAVVAYDGQELGMLSSWSTSAPALERVLADATERPAYGLTRLAERRQFEVETGESLTELLDFGVDGFFNGPLFSRDLLPQEKAYLSRLSDQINRSVAAATATLRSFAMPPGRKVMILLSGGWPFIPADYIVGDLSRILMSKEGPFGFQLYGRLAETANLLGYTLYPVDVPGLDREFEGSAAQRGLPNRRFSLERGFARESEVQATLEYLARETGGQALLNAERVEVFPRVVEDTRSYYWLGFSPQRDRDDVHHEVEVELVNPEFRSRLRSGFLDSSRDTEVNMAVESALLFGSASTSDELSIEVDKPVAARNRRMEVGIKLSFPIEGLTLLPSGDDQVAQLELRVAVLDEKGRQALIPVIPMKLRVPTSASPGTRARYETRLFLRRLEHEAVVAVHDPLSGRILTAGVEIVP